MSICNQARSWEFAADWANLSPGGIMMLGKFVSIVQLEGKLGQLGRGKAPFLSSGYGPICN
jgi:hypothetical protein